MCGEKLKEEGIDRAVTAKASEVELAREWAIEIANEKGEVSIDDVRDAGFDLGKAAGGLFRGSNWRFTGKRIKSSHPANHAREIKVWEYVGGVNCQQS